MTVPRHRAPDNGPDHDLLLRYLREIRRALPGLAAVGGIIATFLGWWR